MNLAIAIVVGLVAVPTIAYLSGVDCHMSLGIDEACGILTVCLACVTFRFVR